MLPDGIIAAIITGILALLGGLGTGYFGTHTARHLQKNIVCGRHNDL
jgi:hypothetical protein